jgi:hydrogenase-4 membrane subunit HyfE
MIGFEVVASLFVATAYFISKKKILSASVSYSLACGLALSVITVFTSVISGNIKYLIVGLLCSMISSISMYFWLRHKKLN